jgi:phosphoribosylformylglycinamidine cyclo-ligase
MFLTFNMGVGMIAVVADDAADGIIDGLERAGERAWRIGRLVTGQRGVSIQ